MIDTANNEDKLSDLRFRSGKTPESKSIASLSLVLDNKWSGEFNVLTLRQHAEEAARASNLRLVKPRV